MYRFFKLQQERGPLLSQVREVRKYAALCWLSGIVRTQIPIFLLCHPYHVDSALMGEDGPSSSSSHSPVPGWQIEKGALY